MGVPSGPKGQQMTESIINDFADLGTALKRIEEAKQPKTEVPEPAKIDWPTMYGVYQAPDDFMGWRDKVFANHLAASQGLREATARLNEANAMAIGTVKMPDGTIQTSKDWAPYDDTQGQLDGTLTS